MLAADLTATMFPTEQSYTSTKWLPAGSKHSHLPIPPANQGCCAVVVKPRVCPVLNNLLADEQASAAAAGKHRLEEQTKLSNCASCPLSLVWLLKGRSGMAMTRFSSSSCSSSISMHNDSTKLMLHCLRSARIQHIINSPCSISPSMGAGVSWHKLLLHWFQCC